MRTSSYCAISFNPLTTSSNGNIAPGETHSQWVFSFVKNDDWTKLKTESSEYWWIVKIFCRLSSTTNTYRHAFSLVSGILVISKLHSFTLSAFALLFALIFINFSAYVNNLQIALALPITLLVFEAAFSDGKE